MAGPPRLGGQPVASFEPPGPEDGPPGPGGHTVPEPMVLGPLSVVGLESALHGCPRCFSPAPPPGRGALRQTRSGVVPAGSDRAPAPSPQKLSRIPSPALPSGVVACPTSANRLGHLLE